MVTNTELLKLLNEYKYDALKYALTENIRLENIKKAGVSTKPATIIKKIIDVKSHNELLSHALKCGDYYGFTNAHILFIDRCDYGYPVIEYDIVNSFMRDIDKYNNTVTYDPAAVMDTIALNKANKVKNPHVLTLESGQKIGADPNYLKWAIDFTGSNIAFYGDILGNCLINPIVFKSGDGERIALVLPVNIRG